MSLNSGPLCLPWSSLLLGASLALSCALGADIETDEETLKAVYSFKFGKFAQWPSSKLTDEQTTLGFCILGKNPFTHTGLEIIEGGWVKGRKLKIANYDSGLLPEGALHDCHIVYVSRSEKDRQRYILSVLKRRPILTVSDIEDFCRKGGMITLVNSGRSLQFEINPEAVTRAGLQISSKLIELARLVGDDELQGRER
ncbi:MAG: YfiR family protein [Gammaproteobacteria bacterium]